MVPCALLAKALAETRAASAVEFSLLLPLLLALYLSGVELTQALDVGRKVAELSRTIADIAAKSRELTSTDLSQLSGLASPLLAPHDPKRASVQIFTVWTDDRNISKVDWSYGAKAPAAGSVYLLPQGLAQRSRQVVVAVVDYSYSPSFGEAVTGPMSLDETVYLAPRDGKCVRRPDASAQQLCNR